MVLRVLQNTTCTITEKKQKNRRTIQMLIRRTSELKFPDEIKSSVFNLALLDNKIWMRHELKKLRGKTARRRDRTISDKLHAVHTPWHQRPHKGATAESQADTK